MAPQPKARMMDKPPPQDISDIIVPVDDDKTGDDFEGVAVTWKGHSPAEFLTVAAQLLALEGESASAFQYFEAAGVIDPEYTLAAWRAAHLSIDYGDDAGALKQLESSLDEITDHAPTYYLCSVLSSRLDLPERALAYADKALARNPSHAGAFLVKLRSLATLERWNDIVCAAERTVDEHETQRLLGPAETALWRALALCHLGMPELAGILYERVSIRLRRRYRERAREIEACLASRETPRRPMPPP